MGEGWERADRGCLRGELTRASSTESLCYQGMQPLFPVQVNLGSRQQVAGPRTLPSPQRLSPLHRQNGQGLGRQWHRGLFSHSCLFLVRHFQSSGRGGCRRIILTDTRPPGVAEVARAECVLCHFLAPGSVSCADYWESDSVPAALLQKPPWERASQQNPHPNP